MNENKEISTGFRWRDRDGVYHDIFEMKTSYIFFVLRMIWNHSVPKHMRITPYKFYSNLFGHPFYTNEYVKNAAIAMIAELSKRDDLTPYFEKCIDHMRKWSSEAYQMETLSN